MSYKYNEYLGQHIAGVKKSFQWLCDHFEDIREKMDGRSWQIAEHDKSKNGHEEYEAYDRYFYGNPSFKAKQEFNYAWLHHIHHNPHHWQYWVLQHDDEPEEALEMPYHYVIEMIADWWSFSWSKGNLDEIFEWYEKHKDMKLHPNTRKLVEKILGRIKKELEYEKEDHLEHHGIIGQKWGVKNGPPYPINQNLKNKTPAEIQAIKNYKGELYFISEHDMDGAILEPRVPKNYFTENGYEDNQNKRVCFSTSVDGCLKGLSQNLTGKTFNVYTPEDMPEYIYKPNKGAVPDSDITCEHWIKEPVKIKQVGQIFVKGDDGLDGIPFDYGDNTAELYGWEYSWR